MVGVAPVNVRPPTASSISHRNMRKTPTVPSLRPLLSPSLLFFPWNGFIEPAH